MQTRLKARVPLLSVWPERGTVRPIRFLLFRIFWRHVAISSYIAGAQISPSSTLYRQGRPCSPSDPRVFYLATLLETVPSAIASLGVLSIASLQINGISCAKSIRMASKAPQTKEGKWDNAAHETLCGALYDILASEKPFSSEQKAQILAAFEAKGLYFTWEATR
jgi:hypothetical protein